MEKKGINQIFDTIKACQIDKNFYSSSCKSEADQINILIRQVFAGSLVEKYNSLFNDRNKPENFGTLLLIFLSLFQYQGAVVLLASKSESIEVRKKGKEIVDFVKNMRNTLLNLDEIKKCSTLESVLGYIEFPEIKI